MNPSHRRRRLAVALGAAVSAALIARLLYGSWTAALTVAAEASPWWIAAALACTAASFMMIALALREVLGMLGYRLAFPEVLGIALVSTTANYVVSSAGISGFALKAHLLRKRGVPYGVTVTAAAVSSAMFYLVLAAIIAQGLAYLLLRRRGAGLPVLEGAAGLAALLILAVPASLFFFHHEFRSRLARKAFHWANRAVFAVSRTEIPREDFAEFEEQLTAGLSRVRGEARGLALAVLYTCLDWGLCLLTLHCALMAVGVPVGVGALSAGFTVGQAATLIPVLPGGIGAAEGGMTATLVALGVAWEPALVAVILYRLSYYALPCLVSVFVLWGLKVSEPALVENTVFETLPEELKRRTRVLERRRAGGEVP